MNKKQKRTRNRILLAIALFVVAYAIAELLPLAAWFGSQTTALWVEFALFLVPYLIAGYDVLLRAAKNIGHGQVFDENFLMSVATIGAFALVLFPDSDPHMAEGAAVMLFYQVGELFQSYAVGKSRKSIADMMDIAPEFANVERDGQLVRVDPYEVAAGDEIVVKPGERVPLDGVVVSGASQLDTAALTGESVPREVQAGDEIISGCVNLTGLIAVRVTKPYGQSTVARILELVENAAEKKAKTENFITRFARYYTPAVVGIAVLLAVIPPLLFGQSWSDWVQRGLIFLVVSCPCALVISVPLSFFGGIGGASRLGILVKGSNYLETLSHAETVVFDKTGTLTDGSFNVVAVHPNADIDAQRLLSIAAHAEAYSNHPIALSVKQAYSGPIDQQRIDEVEERSGHGVQARIDEHVVLVGNDKLMSSCGIDFHDCELTGTILHVSLDGEYIGHIVIADVVKPGRGRGHGRAAGGGREEDRHAHGRPRRRGGSRGNRTGHRRVPRPTAAAGQGDRGGEAAGGDACRRFRQRKARLRGRRHQRRARPHARRHRHRHGRHGVGRRHRGRRRGAHGRQAVEHRPRHPHSTQDHGHRVAEHRVRLGREAARAGAGRRRRREHVACGVRRRGRGRDSHPERHARHERA